MKYNIIVSIFIFLFLNACNPDFNTTKKDTKHQPFKKGLKYTKKKGLKPKTKATFSSQGANSSQEANPKEKEEISSLEEEEVVVGASSQKRENSNIKRKNSLLNDLRNLIKTAHADKEKYIKKMDEEPKNQYEMSVFKEMHWEEPPKEAVSDNTERSNRYRRRTYEILNTIDTSELKEFSNIIISSTKTNLLFNTITGFVSIFDDVIDSLYSKKDFLDKLDISDLEKIKNSFEKLLSIKPIVSKMLNQILLDYKNNENLKQTNSTELKSYITKIYNQIKEKEEEAKKLENDILSINKF
ncbi:virulence associated lipoprotein [Borreliella americana]|uniref:virulence associated lipoprotein n=1 Tax=Borreliella americana TaxID=478807 RepID=UPI001E3F0386|nr:virulence associated lipoprotein [Borreliella americana]MCD2332701.1 virulence associated lipoprotein [Borreliella americana]MCD2382420.1 virulence associated lipoprotein [Borreliella americana]